MSERDRIARVPPEGVVAALTGHSRTGTSGALVVVGDPGGLLRVEGGRVTGAETPGAPGVEALLLRSGRVLEASWVAAYQAAAPGGRFAVELVRRGLVGAAELEAVCLMALFDAAFAITAGDVEECRWEPSAAQARPEVEPEPVGRALWTSGVARVDAQELGAETQRRLAALAQFPAPVRPGRDRLAAVPELAGAAGGAPGPARGGAVGPRAAGGLRREVLGLADGRRTARDIAFLLGRGVYPVTVEASRLMADGLLRFGAPGGARGEVRALLAPRHAASALPPSADVLPAAGPLPLPRRPIRASGS